MHQASARECNRSLLPYLLTSSSCCRRIRRWGAGSGDGMPGWQPRQLQSWDDHDEVERTAHGHASGKQRLAGREQETALGVGRSW